MDLNAKIAARRQEVARQQRQEQAEQQAATARRKIAEEGERQAALDGMADELSADGLTVVREGNELALSTLQPSPPLDVEGLRRSQVARLVNREARRLWTPRDNWIVIGCIVGGVCLLHVAGLGLIPLGIGLLVRSSLNKTYRAQVCASFPSLLQETPPPPA